MLSQSGIREEELLRYYFLSHGGKIEFQPGQSKESFVADGYLTVDQCYRHPTARKHAVSCRQEVATLTEKGIQEGRRLITERLKKADAAEARKYLNLLPTHIRSFFLCLMISDNEVPVNPRGYSYQLFPIADQVLAKAKLSLSLPRTGFDILFGQIFGFFEKIADELVYMGLGVSDGFSHVVAGWRSKDYFDSCTEVSNFLRSLVVHDDAFLVRVVSYLSKALHEPLAKIMLLSYMQSKPSISRLDIQTITTVFPDSISIVEEYIATLQKDGLISKPDSWGRIKREGEIPYSLLELVTEEAIRASENFWGEGRHAAVHGEAAESGPEKSLEELQPKTTSKAETRSKANEEIRLPEDVRERLDRAKELMNERHAMEALQSSDMAAERALWHLCVREGCTDGTLIDMRGKEKPFTEWSFTQYIEYLSPKRILTVDEKADLFRYHNWRNRAHDGIKIDPDEIERAVAFHQAFINSHFLNPLGSDSA